MPFASLKQRCPTVELMDAPDLDVTSHHRALRGLGRVNQFTRSSAVLWREIYREAMATPYPLRILDIACGGGDVTLAIARRADRRRLPIVVSGCDISPVAVQHAQQSAAEARLEHVDFFRLDALHDPLPDDWDVVMCSLFLHHLEERDVVALLRKMADAARRLVLVSDLRRTRWGYVLAWVGCRLLTRSPIIHTDGPLSVAAAFTLPEMQHLVEQAVLTDATWLRQWPQRFLMSWRPDKDEVCATEHGKESG